MGPLFWIVVSLFAVWVLTSAAIALNLCRYVFRRDCIEKRMAKWEVRTDPEAAGWAERHRGGDWSQDTPDGLRLMAYGFPADEPSEDWAILVHGYSDNAESAFPWARRFHERGYHVLAVDCRAHGRSGGNLVGMGWKDRRDLVGWIRQVVDSHPDARIVLYGVSMGAATVMMASGEPDLPEQVTAGVEDCGFTSVSGILTYKVRRKLHVPGVLAIPFTSLLCRFRIGIFLSKASSTRQLAKNRRPMLFIHGEEDRYVPFSMVHPLYNATAGAKRLYTVPGARHAESSRVDPNYWNNVFDFLKEPMPEGK